MIRKQTKYKPICDDEVDVIAGRSYKRSRNIFNFDVLCSFPQYQIMFVDRYPFSSCINCVNVALVWQLLIFPLSGKCSRIVVNRWIVVEAQLPITSKIIVNPKINKNELNILM